jgi:hypothetical protein
MRDAVKYYSIAFGSLIGVILIFYYWGSYLDQFINGELIFILGYSFLITIIIISWFKNPISKKSVRIRLKNYNWIAIIGFSILGVLRIAQGIKDNYPEDKLFGIIDQDYVSGFSFFLLGIYFLHGKVLIDKNGIKLNDWVNTKIDFTSLQEFSLTSNSIRLKTDTDEFQFSTFRLLDGEVQEINNRVDHFRALSTTKTQSRLSGTVG